jgi:hypothetical protein
LQSLEWSFGRSIRARLVLHVAQREGAILSGGNMLVRCLVVETRRRWTSEGLRGILTHGG